MPKIRPMLAAPKGTEKDFQRHLDEAGYLIMQPKIDGMRALIDENLKATTRSGKLHANRHLQRWAGHHPWLQGFDGELFSGHEMTDDVFRQSMSGIRSGDGSREFTFYVFDYFLPPIGELPYEARMERVTRILKDQPEEQAHEDYHAKIVICPQKIVTTIQELNDYEEELVAKGWEGAILRRPDRPYKYNRSTLRQGHLLKVKRFEDDEAVIVGTYPWMENQNEAQQSPLGFTQRSSHKENKVALERLGGFHCELLRDRSVKFDIGVLRGFSHTDRDRLWVDREALMGKIITFAHQGYGGGYDKPRTPVGLHLRDAADVGFEL